MYEIFDKLLMFTCCIALYLFQADNSFIIVPIIISVAISSLFMYYEEDKVKVAGNILFALICFFVPNFIIFLPLLLYDILYTRYQYVVIIVPLLYMFHFTQYSAMTLTLTTIFLITAFVLKYKTDRLYTLKKEFNELRDHSVEISLLMEEKNQSLIKNQDYEINLATLNERNRISKEIHDNIGHLLSRALLQVGALLTITKEEVTQEGLTALKASLSGGMDQIRNSIHHIYDESIDLFSQIDQLVKNFTFCNIHYDYDIKNSPSLQLKHSMIAITKEALANIIRHSNATKVSIQVREHPAMYQLIIQDNGTMDEQKKITLKNTFEKQDFGEGMGLRNIYDRIKSFDGNLNLSVERGFKLFISVPKNSAAQ